MDTLKQQLNTKSERHGRYLQYSKRKHQYRVFDNEAVHVAQTGKSLTFRGLPLPYKVEMDDYVRIIIIGRQLVNNRLNIVLINILFFI